MASIYNYSKEYMHIKLDRADLAIDPFKQFEKWFSDAEKSGILEPNVMILSTAGKNGRPTARIVLLKDISREGYSFFSNYSSKKGLQIDENPYACLLFPWHGIERQVRIEGVIEKLSGEVSDTYFHSRPIGSRIGAWASEQSAEVPSREFLLNKEQEFISRYKDGIIPRPPDWGGYMLKPDLFEFWQGRENRLHDRFEYKLIDNNWQIRRLAP